MEAALLNSEIQRRTRDFAMEGVHRNGSRNFPPKKGWSQGVWVSKSPQNLKKCDVV